MLSSPQKIGRTTRRNGGHAAGSSLQYFGVQLDVANLTAKTFVFRSMVGAKLNVTFKNKVVVLQKRRNSVCFTKMRQGILMLNICKIGFFLGGGGAGGSILQMSVAQLLGGVQFHVQHLLF